MNRILPSLHYGSFEIMLTVLLRVCNFLQDINIDRFHQIKKKLFYRVRAQDLLKTYDPLEYWKTAGKEYQTNLPLVAQDLLCIPATSTPCERVFSQTGNTEIDSHIFHEKIITPTPS